MINKLFITVLLAAAAGSGFSSCASATDETKKPAREPKTEKGQMLAGDFDGDGQTDTAQLIYTEPMDSTTPVEERLDFGWELKFSNDKFPPLAVHGKSAFLVNEGDLDKRPGDELSLATQPINGCSYYWEIYGFANNRWLQVCDGNIVPLSCDYPVDLAAQAERVFREKDSVFILLPDPNDELKTKVKNPLSIR